MTEVYHGARLPTGEADVTAPGGRELPPRNDLRDHSPSGFEWGYGGSGPLQLSLALLADCLGDDEAALEHYKDFNRMLVSHLPFEEWTLSPEEIREAVEHIRVLRGKMRPGE